MASAGNDVLNESLVQCSICFEDMVNEIMICPTGHSLCKHCFDKLMIPRRCPFCKILMNNTRNKSLEKLLTKLGHKNLNWLNDSVTLCAQCSELMDTQIGVCYLGHSSCRNCTIKNKKCKICLSKIDIARNFILESCIRKIKIREFERPTPCQIFADSNCQNNAKITLCPLTNCSFMSFSLPDHILTSHRQQTISLKPKFLYRLAMKNFSEKHIIFKVLESPTEHFIYLKAKVSNSFMMINAEQISKGTEHVLHIEQQGTRDIAMYKFKYANNSGSKKITLRTECLQLSKLGEYVVKISIYEKQKCK